MWLFVLVTDATVFSSAVVLLTKASPTNGMILRTCALFGLSVLFEEASVRVARFRVRLAAHSQVEMTSAWIFGGVIVLQPAFVGLLCALILSYAWLRHGRQSGMRPYRQVFVAAVVIASCFAAHAVMTETDTLLAAFPHSVARFGSILGGMITYTVLNAVWVYAAIYLAIRPATTAQLLENWQEIWLEFATVCLGAFTALAVQHDPAFAVLVIPPMFVLQRGALVRELEVAATTDSKTGLLNAATWHHVAERELARADREHHSAAVLIVDMDNFKRVNDEHGHLVGDDVLKAVAECMAAEMRPYDSIGRFGGEEFVAVLAGVDQLAALTISERIRSRVAAMQVPARVEGAPALTGFTASIGVACYPLHGTEVEDLLHTADAALYSAKRAGRNRVEISAG